MSDNETDDENVDNDVNNSDDEENDGDEDRKNAKATMPLDNKENFAAVEQNGLDVEMAPADDDGANGTTKIQPPNEETTAEVPSPTVSAEAAATDATVSNTTSTSSLFVQPAPVAVSATHPMVALVHQQSNLSEPGPSVGSATRIQCYWCEESFIKETSLRNHCKSDHDVVFMKKEKEESDRNNSKENEPGKYVRPPPMKRKRNSVPMIENNDGNANCTDAPPQQPAKQRKHAKTANESMRRSFPRV